MNIRKLSKTCSLLIILIVSIFVSGCYDTGAESLDSYYDTFPTVLVLDDDLVWDWYSSDMFYNEETEEHNWSPLDADKFKFYAIRIDEDVKINGIASYIKSDKAGRIRIEGYYSDNPLSDGVVLDYAGVNNDMFRGSYVYSSTNFSWKIEVNGTGKLNLEYSEFGGEDRNFKNVPYTTRIIEGGTKSLTFTITETLQEFVMVYKSDDEILVYVDNSRTPYVFTYISGLTYGEKMFDYTIDYKEADWGSFLASEFKCSSGTTKNYDAKEGKYILIRIVNNCYDAKKYDLENMEIDISNVLVSQPT